MTRTLRLESMRKGFPELSASPDGAELLDRWESLLRKVPRLRPWVGEMLGHRRVVLVARLEGEPPLLIERTLWQELARWLREFEALPPFAVSAIATTLQDEERDSCGPRALANLEDAPNLADAASRSPERAVSEMEALLSDPAFALAFHCVEVRLRPRLAIALEAAPRLSEVPEAAWFGLLHSSAPPCALLTPDVAVALVLRVLSSEWMATAAGARRAALRLFGAHPSELRDATQLDRLCRSLPPAWGLGRDSAADFVAVSEEARLALREAFRLCNRIAATVTSGRRGRRGGFALIQVNGEAPAAQEEVEEVSQTARKYAGMTGFRRLLGSLR
ncbi:MAG: hypothetical protein ACJ79H_18910 [Myxococcales bacterium]